jgi:catechol 2,3-dioxygenase-like lactoylglutathione lyase family enzyme
MQIATGGEMPVIGIDHVQLAMPAGQEEQARGFYRDALGLPETPKPAELAKRGGCWFETDRVKIHLGIDKNFHPATKAHPGLLVSDLQAIIERCRDRGFAIIDDAPLDGYQRIFINDPFGNRLELMQKL